MFIRKYVESLIDGLPLPWEQKGSPWKNKSQFLNYLRGGIRRGLWEKYPIKLQYIKDNRKRIKNPRTCARCKPTIWGGECEICNKTFPQSKLQVDHVRDDFNKMEDFYDVLKFIVGLLFVGQANLKLVCKPCHNIVSLSQRRGISFEEAVVEKKVIEFGKLSAIKQKSYFSNLGYSVEDISNADKRLTLYKTLLLKKR